MIKHNEITRMRHSGWLAIVKLLNHPIVISIVHKLLNVINSY